MNYPLQIVMAFLGSLGFALMFNLRKRFLPEASLNGTVCWIIFLLCQYYKLNIFTSSMLASVWSAACAEVLARVHKTPSNQFLIIALMPLVPGGMLYRTMESFVQGELIQGIAKEANQFTRTTMSYALGIAVGISLVYSIQNMINRIILMARKRKAKLQLQQN